MYLGEGMQDVTAISECSSQFLRLFVHQYPVFFCLLEN
jgi:hypothetical protein